MLAAMLFRIAWRNVWRHTRRSVVTMAAMALSLLTMVLYAGLIEGWMHSMEGDVLDLEIGDVQVHAQGYLDDPSLWDVIEDADGVVARLRDQGIAASERLTTGGLGGHDDLSAGVLIRGVSVEGEPTISTLPGAIDRGAWLSADDPKGVVIGRRLARTLDADVGDELILLTQDADGGMANDLFTVRGVLLGVGARVDGAGVLMSVESFRTFAALESGAHEIVARRSAGQSLDDLVAAVSAAAPEADVQTWRQLMPIIATMIDAGRQMTGFIVFVVYLAIGILMLNAMLMAVFERIRELGVMKALGMGPLQVFFVVVLEVAIQLGISGAIAGVLSVPAAWYMTVYGIQVGALSGASFMGLAIDPAMKGHFTAEVVATPVILLIVIVGFACLFPAIRAARLHPVDAMRHR